MSELETFVYVALYDLSSGHQQVLLFKKGDQFIPVFNCSNNPNWAVCVDSKGNTGYVPYTYVQKKQVSSEEYICLIDDALEKLHVDSPTSTSKFIRDILKNLTAQRSEQLGSSNPAHSEVCEETTIVNLSSSVISTEAIANDSEELNPNLCPISSDIEPICSDIKSPESQVDCATQTDSTSELEVPNWLVPSLIENVRNKTNLSHENTKTAVATVLDTFLEAIPKLDRVWIQLRKDLIQLEVLQKDTPDAFQSEDQRKLLDIFRQLWYCKNDEQQRSWPVHEDEDLIGGLLLEMNNILLDANPRVTREVVRHEDYEMVNLLATYYQMEPRKTLRLKILYVFLTLCELDVTVVSHLLTSVLPMELARDIQDNFEDQEKTLQSSFLLSVIFSTGEKPPTGTYEFINKKFLRFLLDKLEEVVKESDDELGQNLLSVVLAFNLHFQNETENLVLETLKEMQTAQVLTEKLVFLINREEDPCRTLIPDNAIPNSVLKFITDLFSHPSLVDLFYLNDVKVLIDIIVRQLTDILPGEKKRLDYLCLVRNLLRNSNYGEHLHQVLGLEQCFKFILNQEFPDDEEVTVVLEIIHEFQTWFQNV